MGRRAFYAEGPLADRPPARREGLIYYAMDENATYMDDGIQWVVLHAEPEPVTHEITYDQFVPGKLQPKAPLATIANPTTGAVILRHLEANLQSPPSTVGASNNLVLDVYGTTSGLVKLPLDTNAQTRFVVKTSGIIIEGDINIGLSQIGAPGSDPGADMNVSLKGELGFVSVGITGTAVASFAAPDASPTGLTWDGSHLWTASWPYIYRIKASDGTVDRRIDAPSNGATGLAWDGTYLWNADYGSDTIYRLNPDNGTILQQFAAPSTYSTGLTWDGSHLWSADNDTNTIYRIDPNNGAVVQSFAAPALFPTGLAWDGLYLWVANYDTDTIYRVYPQNGSVVQQFLSPGDYPWGLAFDGDYLWSVDDITDTVYKME